MPMKWWQLIDDFKDGPAAWWRDELAGDFVSAEPFLRPSDNLSLAFPCQHSSTTGCAYEVVKKPSGEMVGICREDRCERREFTRADLATYTLDGASMAAALAGALNLDQQVEKVPDVPWVWLAGFYFPTMGFRFPVLLVLPDTQDSPEQIIAQLVARHENPIIVLPTKRGVTTAVERLLADRGCGLLVLDGAVSFSPNGKLLIGAAVDHALAGFRAKHVPEAFAPTIPTFFPTPPKARWGDLKIRMQNNHDAYFAIGSVSKVLSYSQVGLASEKNNEPTKAWRFLVRLAGHRGELRPTQVEQGLDEKSKQALSKRFQEFFRIDGDPIPWCRTLKGWDCQFHILPEGAEV